MLRFDVRLDVLTRPCCGAEALRSPASLSQHVSTNTKRRHTGGFRCCRSVLLCAGGVVGDAEMRDARVPLIYMCQGEMML